MNNKNYTNKLLSIFVFGLLISCHSQKCDSLILSNNISTYKAAIEALKSTNFLIEENCNTHKSSWILRAEYYSCNGKQGYFLITTSRKTYIHYDLPLEVWNEFKNADSFGKFYNAKIKSKYQLHLE